MQEHQDFDRALERYEEFNRASYSHAEHVEHVRAVVTSGQRLLHALGVRPVTERFMSPTDAALQDAALWALQYFERTDAANAAVHCAPVKYSPITFRLARALHAVWPPEEIMTEELRRVMQHDGLYQEDAGR